MHKSLGLWLIALPFGLALFGGSAQSQSEKSDTGTEKETHSTIASGFDTALESFREHAAREYEVLATEVAVVPDLEASAKSYLQTNVAGKQIGLTIGEAWAFEAGRIGVPGPTKRGWAFPDGTVVTPKKNLGRLLVEAGVWSSEPSYDIISLTHQLVWSFGPQYTLKSSRPQPALERSPDGSGTYRFFVVLHAPSGNGPRSSRWESVHECKISLTSDRKANLEWSENLNK